MSKTRKSKLFEWCITRIRSTPAAFIGYVEARDSEQAIRAAIWQYDISNPHEQAAQRVREVG
jgi:hypothetical protein